MSRQLQRGLGRAPEQNNAQTQMLARQAMQHFAATQQFAEAEPDSPSLDYWGVMRRRWMTIALAAAGAAALGLCLSLLQPPVYRAHVSLEIDEAPVPVLTRSGEGEAIENSSATATDLPTQVKILGSRALIERAVGRLKLDHDPEFLKSSGLLARLRETFGKPQAPVPLNRRHERAISQAEAALKVRPAGQTRIIEILFDSANPQLAADFPDTLAEEFMTREFEIRSNTNDATTKWLSDQLAELKGKLQRSELELQSYAEGADLVFTSEHDNIAEEKLREIQGEYSKAQANRAVTDSKYEVALASPPDSLADVLDSDLIRDYRDRLSELRRQLADYDTVLTPENAKVKRLKAQVLEVERALEAERANIVKRISNEAHASRRREEKLQAAFDFQSKRVSKMAFRYIKYDMLKREVDTNRQVYDSMLQKVKGMRIASAMRSSNVHVIDRASVPTVPFQPNTPLNCGLGLMSGLFGGVLLAFVMERADSSVHGPGMAPMLLQLPELGAIPSAKAQLRAVNDSLPTDIACSPQTLDVSLAQAETVSWDDNHSPMAGSYRAVLTSILFQGRRGQHHQVITVTSPSPGEGKTTTVSNLAITAAGILGRVLIIDGDHVRPTLHKIFNVSNSWGLSELLREHHALDDLTLEGLARPTPVPGLFILPSGSASLNTSNLLYSGRMAALLKRLKEEFDMILIDTPPSLVMPDARAIARLTTGVVLVFRDGKTTRKNAIATAKRFREDSTPILGTILNDWDHKRDGYNYYGEYFQNSRKRLA